MDIDPREYMDLEEDYNKLYEDELENLRDVEEGILSRTNYFRQYFKLIVWCFVFQIL